MLAFWRIERDPGGFGIVPDAAETARQELREEIGAVASRVVELGEIYPDSGRGAGRVAMFLAEVEAYGEAERLEGITTILPTAVAEFERMIAGGELSNGFLLAASARAKARRLL
jgi:hypothetical protein